MTAPLYKTSFWLERSALFVSLFFFAFGMGLIADGKKLYTKQLHLSQQVDFKSTLNPYSSTLLRN